MGLQIEDGKGHGHKAEVNEDQQLIVKAVIESDFEFASEKDGEAFTWTSVTYSASGDDTLLLIKNTNQTLHLHIDKIFIGGVADSLWHIHLPTADVTVAGTTVTGVNLNTTFNTVAESSAATDETGNSQGNIIWSGHLDAHTTSNPYIIDFSGALILGRNKSIGIDCVSAQSAFSCVVFGHFS